MKNHKSTDQNRMNIMYLFGIYIAAKIIYSAFKKDSPKTEEVAVLSVPEEELKVEKVEKVEKKIEETDAKPAIEIPNKTSRNKPTELGKNSFLYTDDNFGRLERGRE